MLHLEHCALHLVTTIFNTAPGVKSLSPDHFSNTDILCLNETEVRLLILVPYIIRCMDLATHSVILCMVIYHRAH